MNDAPAAFQRPLQKNLFNSVEVSGNAWLRFRVSSFDPRLYFAFRGDCGAVGAFAPQIEEVPTRGASGVLPEFRAILGKRFGAAGI